MSISVFSFCLFAHKGQSTRATPRPGRGVEDMNHGLGQGPTSPNGPQLGTQAKLEVRTHEGAHPPKITDEIIT